MFAAAEICDGGIPVRYCGGRNGRGIEGPEGDEDDCEGALMAEDDEIEADRISEEMGVPSRLVGVEFALLAAPILAGDGSIGGVDCDLAPNEEL